MELRLSHHQSFPNLAVIRKVLEEMGGSEVVELTGGDGPGMLRWSQQDGSSYHLHTAIPKPWLADPDNENKVREAARHFANGVRFASQR